MIKRITSITTHETAEGMRASFTYSLINEDGQLVKSNTRATCIILDNTVLDAINIVNQFLVGKIPAE